MFRPMRRFKQQVSDAECIKILKEEPRGVLAVYGENDYPYCFPINFYYDEAIGKIYFHGAREGHKVDAIKKNNHVCFTVMNQGFKKENDWAYSVISVIIFGRVEDVIEPEEKNRSLQALAEKYYPSKEAATKEVLKDGNRANVIALVIDHMTGKLVHEA